MNDEYEVIEYKPEPRQLSLGALPTTGPVALIKQASQIATELAKIIKSRKMTSRISDREFVHVEGWSTMGAMLGVLPREIPEQTRRLEDGSYVAVVELIRINDGAVIGRASAICGMDEKDRKGKLTWGNRAEYARRSMAVTRATGKAFRLGFSWIMALAGYEPTPAEEMIDTGDRQPPKTITRKKAKKPATKATNGNGTHWIDGQTSNGKKVSAMFWAWAKTEMGLKEAEVHLALEVEHIHDYAGSMGDAKTAISEWIARQADAQVSIEVDAEDADG